MTRERYIDQWPKPMFLCTYCDEQTDSDPCQECASVFDERGENYPPVLRFQVVPAPAQPEQPRGEGDDLAARLEDAATTAQRIGAKHREEGNSAASSYYRGQRNAYNEAAELARASCHPEQRGGSIRGCSPSSTRTPPTNAGRRGLAGSTDTNAPRGSCSNEPMPR